MATIIEKEKNQVDEYLMRIRQGDRSALSLLYRATTKPLYALCYTYTHTTTTTARMPCRKPICR